MAENTSAENIKIESKAKARGAGRGLGRGLSALFGDDEKPSQPEIETSSAGAKPRALPIAFLKPNRFQPRTNFREDDLKDLAASIREKGVLQPIVVRPTDGPDSFEIVAGERRWRAAQLAKLHEVPVIIREFSDSESLEIAIIENVQRADLDAVEEAVAYQELIKVFSYTQEQLSEVIGKSRSHIANTLRLLKLPEGIKALIAEGKISAGHARTLIGKPNVEQIAQEIVSGAMNVRQAEQHSKQSTKPKKLPAKDKDTDTKALEKNISNTIGMHVEISHRGEKGGEVKIRYKTLEQLDDLMHRLSSYAEVD
jgi:ParB family transcriptional regulator, chromosome partitioning protein